MSAPSIIGESDPPKAWIETIQRSLRNYNTAATGIVEFYPVVFLIKDASNSVSGGVLGNFRAAGCTYDRYGSIRCGVGAAMRPT